MMDTTSRIRVQEYYREIGLTTGKGVVEQIGFGAFVVYSRITPSDLLNEIQKVKPKIQSLEEMKTIFLLGPTPAFFGENKASTSWRRAFVEYVKSKGLGVVNDSFMIVLPEPKGYDWKEIDYPNLKEPIEHIYGQTHWETYFIDLAVKTGVLVLHSYYRWKGNAGPTARFEGGKLFALASVNALNSAVVNIPKDSQTGQYADVHLVDVKEMYKKGRFALTSCSPLNLNEEGIPVDSKGNITEAGLYSDGSIEPHNMDPFFDEIVKMANSLLTTPVDENGRNIVSFKCYDGTELDIPELTQDETFNLYY